MVARSLSLLVSLLATALAVGAVYYSGQPESGGRLRRVVTGNHGLATLELENSEAVTAF